MKKLIQSALLGISLIFIPCIGFSASHNNQTDKHQDLQKSLHKSMRQWVQDEVKDNDIIGLSVAVIDDQKILWAEGFGWADKKERIKATPETIYQTGSITKLFTATAIMQLAEKGLVDIDAPLQAALPAFSMQRRFDNTAPITPRNMMSHQSGLPSDWLNGMWTAQPKPFTHLVEALQGEYLTHPANTARSYSNIAVTLLGHVIENASPLSYEDAIQASLLNPLGMTQSYIATTLKEGTDTAQSYADNKAITPIPLRDLPAGGLNSSVLDMAKFAQMVFASGQSDGQAIIQSASLEEMLKYQDTEAPFTVQAQQGLGWFLHEDAQKGAVASHEGSTMVHNSTIKLLTDHQLGVVILTNSDTAADSVGAIAEGLLNLAFTFKTGDAIRKQPSVKPKKLAATKAAQAALPGRYSSEDGLLEIISVGDHFEIEQSGESIDLVRREDDLHYFHYSILGISVNLGELGKIGISHATIEGREFLIGHLDGGQLIMGEKILPTIIPDAWKQRLGRYTVLNSEGGVELSNVELRIEDNLLLIQLEQKWPYYPEETPISVALVSVDDQQAVTHGLGRGSGETIFGFHQEGKEHIRFQGYLMQLE